MPGGEPPPLDLERRGVPAPEGHQQREAGVSSEPQRRVAFEGVVNFRDLGGYPAVDGRRTCWHRLYRSDALHRLTGSDMAVYEGLGVRTVFDLRSEEERCERPNPMPSRHVCVEAHVPREE